MTRLLRSTLAAFLTASCIAGLDSRPARAEASEAAVQAHLEEARVAAGEDLAVYLRLCQPAAPARTPLRDEDLLRAMALPAPEPTRVFDNLSYVGSGWVGAWVLETSDGLVLIDALNTADEVDRLIVGGLRRLGLDAAQIKAVLITHGHGDHYGGAQRVREVAAASRPRLVMSEVDWTMTQTQLEFASPLWPPAPRRTPGHDLAARDGDLLRQGDAELLLPLTPGHSLGTISPVFEVKAGGRSHRAIVWGGTGFNFGRDPARVDAYITAAERMRELAQRQRVEVLLSNHPSYDGTLARLARLRAEAAGPNPFVIGHAAVLRALTVIAACGRANRERFQLQS